MAFSGGSGSLGDPYLISNVTDLTNLYTVGAGSGLYFLQTNDITVGTLTRPFNSNGTTAYAFVFTYDGNGYKIQNGSLSLTYSLSNENPSLFGAMGSGGIIKNLKFKNITIQRTGAGTSNIGVGIIVGYFANSEIFNCVIESDCLVTTSSSSVSRLGGISGYGSDAGTNKKIYSCENHGTISSAKSGDYVGGIMGMGGGIYNCYNTGTITGISKVGGLIGYGSQSSSTNILAENSYNSGIIKGADQVGGIVGYGYIGKISNCFALQSSMVKTSPDPSFNKYGRIVGELTANSSVSNGYALSTMVLSNGWL